MKRNLFSRIAAGIPLDQRINFFYWYMDIAWWGLYMGSTVVFLSVYATRIGATAQQIGWLNAAPAIVSLILVIPFGLWARRIETQRGVWISALIARLLLLAYVFVPFIKDPVLQVQAILLIATLCAAPNIMVGILFGPLMLSSIPSEWRATVVGNRNAILAVITFIFTLLSGQLLARYPSPTGYQIVFFIGFLGAVFTAYCLSKVKVNFPAEAVSSAAGRVPSGNWLPKMNPAGRKYIRVVALLLLFNTAGFMFAPLAPLFAINDLHLNDGTIALASALGNMLDFLVTIYIPKTIRRLGNRNSTAIGAALIALQMLLLAFTRDTALYMVTAVVGGVASGVLGIAQFNYHLENLPLEDRTVWMSWNALFGNLATLLGSVAGPLLAGWTGMPVAFAILAALRLLIAGAIWKRG